MNIQFLKANNGDSILISLLDENQQQRNIVIDSGMPQTYFFSSENSYGDFKNKVVKPISDSGQKIDLLIVTHLDEDHIGGVWKWFAKEKDTAFTLIESIWFNSGKIIADEFALTENPLLQHNLDIFETSETSIKQAVTFEGYISSHKIWGKQLIGAGQVYTKFGLDFTILSPGIKELKDLVELYKGEVSPDYFTSGDPLDYERTVASFIEEEKAAEWEFEEDDDPANGSSIAFIMEYQEKKFLFLADAHPGVIIENLKPKYSPENPLVAEFVKISHHGSSYNTSAELLSYIKTDNYIISTSGQKHSHPHKRTISRIVSRNPKANIYFNYDAIRQTIWRSQDQLDYPDISVKTISAYPFDI